MILEPVRSQRVYITLLGPRNETLTGQLNITDFESTGRTGHHQQEDGLAAKDDVEVKHQQYDSRGAAYYICVFILVYAFAIVMFVASLAKRRRFEQSGDFCRIPKSEILHYYISEGTVSIRETLGPVEQKGRWGDGGPESGIHLNASGGSQIWTGAEGPNDPQIGTCRQGVTSAHDELITLVQVLPRGDDEPRLDDYYWTEGEEPDGGAYLEPDQRCRWSIGPDGNLFILQVDENDSCAKFGLDGNRDPTCCGVRIPVHDPAHQKYDTQMSDPNVVRSVNANDSIDDSRSISHDNLSSGEFFGFAIEKSASKGNILPKCNSVSLFQQQDSSSSVRNYSCEFGNPWGLTNTYPEIQKLLHVTSV